MMICCGMAVRMMGDVEEDERTDCEGGDSDTDW